MDMTINWDAEDLTALRGAAGKYDWGACQVSAAELIRRLPANDALQLAIEGATAYLPTFEHSHPDFTAPRILLTELSESRTTNISLPIYDPEFHNMPGAFYFLEVVLALLTGAVEHIEDDQQLSISLSIDVIRYVIGECMWVTYWANKYPTYWDAMNKRERMNTDVKASRKDPEIQQYMASLWLTLADNIEKRL